MFRSMRRKNQALSDEENIEVLKACSTGVLAVIGDDGYPYTVPLNYIFNNGKLYFHCARDGHKIDSIERDDKVSFCVIAKDKVIPKAFATNFRSVIVFGKARPLTDDNERRIALECLVEKYSPDYPAEGRREIDKDWNAVYVVEINIEHMTGKAALKSIREKDRS